MARRLDIVAGTPVHIYFVVKHEKCLWKLKKSIRYGELLNLKQTLNNLYKNVYK